MRNLIGKLAFFAAGTGIGVFLLQPGSAQQNDYPGVRLNHIGVYAKDYNESLRFYTQVMGFREAFTVKDKDGNPGLTYLQVNRDQFLQLAPATAERPAGLSHIDIWPLDQSARNEGRGSENQQHQIENYECDGSQRRGWK